MALIKNTYQKVTSQGYGVIYDGTLTETVIGQYL